MPSPKKMKSGFINPPHWAQLGRFLGERQALGIDFVAAFGAHEARHVAVELIHHAVARHGVQVVDVLRDDAAQAAFLLPFGQDEMSGLG
jgi:hypothetical protein